MLRSAARLTLVAAAAAYVVAPAALGRGRGTTTALRMASEDILAKAAAVPAGRGAVITGAAGGVGFAYADEFMRRGHNVVICDVNKQRVAEAGAVLAARYPGVTVEAVACDVSRADDIADLVAAAQKALGTVHYWINNAGVNGGRRPLIDVPDEQIELVVRVNLLGTLLCSKAAIILMRGQQGVDGHVFNTVGSGVKGGGTPGYASYGSTKRGLPQLTDSLNDELAGKTQGYQNPPTPGTATVHTLSPGMVFTALLLQDSTKELRKFPFGVLAAQPEEVGQDLVPKILASEPTDRKAVEFLTTDRILTKFFERFILQKKSEYIDDDGDVIKLPDAQYNADGVRALF